MAKQKSFKHMPREREVVVFGVYIRLRTIALSFRYYERTAFPLPLPLYLIDNLTADCLHLCEPLCLDQ